MKLITQAAGVVVTLALLASVISCVQMEIFVKVLSGVRMKFQVEFPVTVADLKEKIRERTGVPCEVQRLVFETDMRRPQNLALMSGSTVFLVLFSQSIGDIGALNRAIELRTAASNKNDFSKGPILREVSRNGDESKSDAISHSKIYEDTQNWIFTSLMGRCVMDMFDPTARLELSSDEKQWLLEDEQLLLHPRPQSNVDMCAHLLRRARNNIANFMRQHRSRNGRSERHGISVGTTWPQGERLDANINNYAPTSFTDQEIVRLFVVSEMVREQLENNFGLARQKEINQGVLIQYASAIAGYEPAADIAQPGDDETCGICRDNLSEEPACKLVCNHSYHTDCLHQWAQDLNRQQRVPICPYCRKPFRDSFIDVK